MGLTNSINLELFEKGPTVLFVWKNSPGWPVESVSANLHTVFNYTPDQYLSGDLHYADQIHPDDLERVVIEVQKASSDSSCDSITHQPYRYLDGHGKYRWVKDSTRIIRSEYGDITHYVGYLVDMTTEVELKAESELLKERLELAWSATNDGLWDWEIASGKVYFSNRWKAMIGYAPDEFPNDPSAFFEAIHPEDQPSVQSLLQRHFADPEHTPYEIDIRMRTKEGTYKWIRTRGKTTLNPDGTPHRMAGAHMDISDYKESQLELEESEKRWRIAVDGSGDGLWDWNILTNEVYFSDRWKKMLGFEPDEIQNTLEEWSSRIHPEDLERVYSDVQQCMDGVIPIYRNKHRVLCKDGSYKWILDRGVIIEWNDKGDPKRMVGTHTDIDESEKNHHNLKLLQRRYASMFYEHSSVMLLIDPQSGQIIDANKSAESFYGYTREEFLTLTTSDLNLLSTEEIDHLRWKAQAKKENHFIFPHRLKNGAIRMVEVFSSPIETESGTLLYSIIRDVTDAKANEAKLIDLNEKLTNLAQNVPGVVYTYQYFPDGRNCFPYASEHIYDIYGVTPAQVRDDASIVFSLIHPDDIPHVVNSITVSFEQLTLWEDEYRVLHPDKGIIWVKGVAKPVPQEDGSVLWYGYIFDVTERKRAELVIKSHVAYLKTDTTGIITEISENFCELFRCANNGFEVCAEKFIGQNINILKSGNTDPSVYRRLWQTIKRGDTLTHQIEDRNPNGENNWYRVTITPDTDQTGKVKGYIAFYNNIDNEVRFEHDAHTDFLTGLHNRSKLEKRLQDEMSRSQRYNTPLSLIIVDIDHFKHVNDTYGHDQGDLVLKEISTILSQNIRQSDTVARWGGEEFIIVCPHTDMDGASDLAELLRTKIEKHPFTRIGHMTASFGVAQYNQASDPKILFTAVDTALYASKAAGRNTVTVFT